MGSSGRVCYLGPPVGLKRLLILVVAAAAMSLGLASSAPAGNFDEQRMGCTGEKPGICPTGTTGTPYQIPIELVNDEDEGCSVTRVGSGSFPPGLVIESDALRISGTPTQAGTFDFFLTVSYDRSESCLYENPEGSGVFVYKTPSDDEFRININEGLAKLTLGPEAAAPATVGSPYTLQMTATVADAKTWSISAGSLPTGVALNAATGLISGTPTTAGQFDFTVSAKMNGDTRSDTKALGIVVRERVAIAGSEPFTTARRAVGEVTSPFEAMLVASGGTGTYTWSLTSGTLPDGLALAEGAIAGTPTESGTYPFIATVTDSEGRTATYPGRIVVATKLAISPVPLRPGMVGKYYSAKLKTLGGVKPATWRLVRGPLPRGLRFDRAFGQIYGTPRLAGRYRVTFEARDALGIRATKTIRIQVAAAPKPKRLSG